MNYWSQELFSTAWNFASEAHARKPKNVPGTVYPYINHLGHVVMEVMTALAQSKTSDDIKKPYLAVQCALLHDVIEDTDATYKQIVTEFGKEVAEGVLALTKNKKLQKEEQMKDSLERIRVEPKEVWMVKLADRITNLQPPPSHWDKDKIIRYREEASKIHQALESADTMLSLRLLEKIGAYEKYIPDEKIMEYQIYIWDNFHYMDINERSDAGSYDNPKKALEAARSIVDRSLRWERLQSKNPQDPDELYDRYTDFGKDPSIRPNDPDFKFSAWGYAKERSKEIVLEDINDKTLYKEDW
jgi:hypothetical protein